MKKYKEQNSQRFWCAGSGKAQSFSLQKVYIPREIPAGFLFLSLTGILAAAFLFLCQPVVQADEGSVIMVSSEVTDRPFGERKILRGHIGGISREGLALELSASQEMWFPYTVGMRLSGYSSAHDIQTGDEVVITYEEDTEKSKRVLREINFVQRKAPAPEVPESDEPEAAL